MAKARAAARNNIIDESIDRVQRAFESANEEIERLQKRARKSSDDLSERAQARAREVQDRLLEIPAFKKAEDMRRDMRKRAESNLDDFMKILPVASDGDIKKINRKLNTISRKLKALEKAQADLS